jgi:hypothetical protein
VYAASRTIDAMNAAEDRLRAGIAAELDADRDARALSVDVTGEPEEPSAVETVEPPRTHTWPANASSNVSSFEHDERSGELRVRFKSGARYAYANVTSAQVDAWLKFPSPGQWLYQNLKAKPDVHPCRAISSGADE